MSWQHPRARRADTSRQRRAGSTARGLAAVGSVLLLAGCTGRDLALPTGATSDTEPTAELWLGAWIAAGIVGVFVLGLILWAIFRYRRRSDDEIPPQVRYNLPIEVLYTIAPVIVVLVFFFHTIETDAEVYDRTPDASHEILVVAQKWSWSFNYLKEDATGQQDVFTVGTPAQRPTLVLPVNESVKFDLRSQDVIHSFWIPAIYFKLDVMPGRENSFTITPTREGTYAGRCSELCGLYHSRMLFTVEVVDRETYDDYLVDLQDSGNIGILEGASLTDDIVGSDQPAEQDGADQ